MKNIFENSKFGDKFRTRDGRMAIFSHIFFSEKDNEIFVTLMIPSNIIVEENHDCVSTILVSLDGTWHPKKHKSDYDIVSRWQEPIDEEELDKLAEEFCDKEYENPTDVNKAQNGLELGYSNLLNCFKAGYHKAKE